MELRSRRPQLKGPRSATTRQLPARAAKSRLNPRYHRQAHSDTDFDSHSEVASVSDTDASHAGHGAFRSSLPATGSRKRAAPATPPRTRSWAAHRATESDLDEDPIAVLPNTAKRPRQQLVSRKSKRQSPKKTASASSTLAATPRELPRNDINIPAWATLPFDVLLNIFELAVAPPNDDDTAWLLRVACMCKSFAEPAITALYRTPALTAPSKLHRLVTTLTQPSQHVLFNYRYKIRTLRLEVGSVVAPSWNGQHVDFDLLLRNMPRLAHLDLYHHMDMSPYHQLKETIRWTYPAELFQALDVGVDKAEGEDAPVKLKSWRWSSRLARRLDFDNIWDVHQSVAFRGLKKISFVNFQVPSTGRRVTGAAAIERTAERDADYCVDLAACINTLGELEHLVLESSSAVHYGLFVLLSHRLKHLEITNCWHMQAEHLADYLVQSGSELETLVLNHNQSLSLEFLPSLKMACPKLRELRVNLSLFSHAEVFHDSSPLYEVLLKAEQVPTWPPGLEILEIENMRHLDSDALSMFFTSIIKSAADLPMLRHIAIKAMINIPWRERSTMRDVWVERMERTFLRPKTEPTRSSTLSSFKKAGMDEQDVEMEGSEHEPVRPLSLGTRKSSRIAPRNGSGSSRASSVAPAKVRYKEPNTDDEMSLYSGDPMSEDGGGESELQEKPWKHFIQGMCEVVDVKLDNQKPTEMQFRIDDFLDDPPSDESEWDGYDLVDDEGHAW